MCTDFMGLAAMFGSALMVIARWELVLISLRSSVTYPMFATKLAWSHGMQFSLHLFQITPQLDNVKIDTDSEED